MPACLNPLINRTINKNKDIFHNTQIVYNLHHPENKGQFEDSSIIDLLGLPDDIDKDSLQEEDGSIDILKLGLRYSDHVVTGNHLTNQFDELFERSEEHTSELQSRG